MANQTYDICKENYNENIILTRTGILSLRLGDIFSNNNRMEINEIIQTNSSLLNRIFKFKIASKEVLWKPAHLSKTKQDSSQTE